MLPHRPLSALALLGLLACSAESAPTDVPLASAMVGTVEFHAGTNIMESFPVQLGTEVTARNVGASAADVVFPDGCVVLLRAYRIPERSGTPAWDQARAVGCTMAIVPVTIAPGETEDFRMTVSAADILGDSLPDGRYYLSAVLRPNQQTIELPAGEADLAVPR